MIRSKSLKSLVSTKSTSFGRKMDTKTDTMPILRIWICQTFSLVYILVSILRRNRVSATLYHKARTLLPVPFSRPFPTHVLIGYEQRKAEITEAIGRIRATQHGKAEAASAEPVHVPRRRHQGIVRRALYSTPMVPLACEAQCPRTTPWGRCGDDTFFIVFRRLAASRANHLCQVLTRKLTVFKWAKIATDLRVTCSIGVAEGRVGEPARNSVIRAAIGMSTAKQRGKNTVQLGPQSGCSSPVRYADHASFGLQAPGGCAGPAIPAPLRRPIWVELKHATQCDAGLGLRGQVELTSE
jgi:hypothetical protein